MKDNASDKDSHYGQNDNTGDLNYMPFNVIKTTLSNPIPITIGKSVFHLTETMI